jgi:hypothetical protein
MGAALRNLGSGIEFLTQRDPLPREWRLGLALVQMMNRKLCLSMDYGQERVVDAAIYTGAEYWIHPMMALRLGLMNNLDPVILPRSQILIAVA